MEIAQFFSANDFVKKSFKTTKSLIHECGGFFMDISRIPEEIRATLSPDFLDILAQDTR